MTALKILQTKEEVANAAIPLRKKEIQITQEYEFCLRLIIYEAVI